jgi:hypothetical protein
MRRRWTHCLFGVAAACSGASVWAGFETSAAANLSMSSVLVAERPNWLSASDDCGDDESGSASGSSSETGVAAPTREATAERPSESARVLLAVLDKKSQGGAASAVPPVPTAAPVPAAPAAPAIPTWEIRSLDGTLNAALARWATSAGWQLLWEVPVDYAVEADTKIPGSFEEAVEAVIRNMETSEIPLKAIFYKGNHVLRIVVKGAE